MRSVSQIAGSFEIGLKQRYGHALTLWRHYSPRGRRIASKRAKTDQMLDALARTTPHRFHGNVLIDAMWDNPNYWLRYSLLRAALGLSHGHEVGLLGEFRQRQSADTLRRLGVRTIESFGDVPVGQEAEKVADGLIAQLKSADDILKWKLPGNVHPAIVYDGILKRQRLASVDISEPRFRRHVIDALEAIERGARLLDRRKFDLVVITHPFNFTYGALAWQALSRGIPVVLPFGAFGSLRFTRFGKCEDLVRYHDRPTGRDIDGLAPTKADALAAIGRSYLQRRLAGQTGDLPSQFAFQRSSGQVDREQICRRFGWDPKKPIVAFYTSNWYDWPHQLGMTQFRDFLDWTEATFRAARSIDRFNWLFKPHPAESWFGGIALADIFAGLGSAPHIGLSDAGWSSTRVLQAADALITYHGTAGIEFTSLGKPVLVPDRGNYDDCGFVKVAQSRSDYLDLLAMEWWRDMDLNRAQRRAEIFAGWWFCMPDWQRGFVLSEDAQQDALYDSIPGLLNDNREVVDREIGEIRDWWLSGNAYLHTSKMARADRYVLSNVIRAN